MTGSEQREAARQFINRWRGKGEETKHRPISVYEL